MPWRTPQKTSAFTMIELTFVLVILGLLAGSIVTGKMLIQSAKLQKIVKDINGFKTAVNAFKTQYDSLPGDFSQGYSYWSTDARCLNNPANPYYCNGNGSNIIGDCPDTTCGHFTEDFYFWYHMYLAGVIPIVINPRQNGTTPGNPPRWGTIGRNIPAGPLPGTGYTPAYGAWTMTHPIFGRRGNGITLGSVYTGSDYVDAGALTPVEASSIDVKADDGEADGGNIRPVYTNPDISTLKFSCIGGTGISFVTPITTGSYAINDSTASCRMFFFLE